MFAAVLSEASNLIRLGRFPKKKLLQYRNETSLFGQTFWFSFLRAGQNESGSRARKSVGDDNRTIVVTDTSCVHYSLVKVLQRSETHNESASFI